uniref:Type I restriction endonuclease subunit R n=1 Tax=Cyanothece sp. (strain PCC 7425 / ATCC 29141) TaxID=395961 RepID=B8HS65_CYAP4
MSIAITEAITTLATAERQFRLLRTEDEAFFLEWQTQLPELSDPERSALDELRRYLYQRSQGQLLEGTVTLLLASPLLAIAGFYDPPFRVRAEESVQLTLEDGEEVQQEQRLYGLSRVLSPFASGQELRHALQILKRIGRAIGGTG